MPQVKRPYMPGYGVLAPGEGTGLLPWAWAEERLRRSHDYWVATTWPDGRPHVMPVWGVWHQDALWFSSSLRSRKARNLQADPRCVVTTDDAQEPVVVDGVSIRVTDLDAIAGMLTVINQKYDATIDVEFLDPGTNATFRIEPAWAFALDEKDFSGSPTRWQFGSS